MQIILFIFYILFFGVYFYYYQINKNTGFSFQIIFAVFLLKILGGVANLYVHYNELLTNDVGFFYTQSIKELTAMPQNPSAFFKEWLFNWGDLFHHLNPLVKGNTVYWNNLGMLIHYKYMTLANIFSLGNLYVNIILFNVMYFIGQLMLYKTLYLHQPHKKYLFLTVVFFIPSVVFWCSGIHKDGIVLSAIGFVTYYMYQLFQTNKRKYFALVIVFMFLLLITRFFYLLVVLFPILIWIFTENKTQKIYYFLAMYFIAFFMLFSINALFPNLHLLQFISNRQADFMQVRGYSDIQTPILEPNFISYVKNFPSAVNHIFLQPYFHFTDKGKYQIAALDTMLIFTLTIIMSIFIKQKNYQFGVYLFLLFCAVSVYLFIGYTIPNVGALVRYKSEFTVLLLSALVGLSEVPFLKRFYVSL